MNPIVTHALSIYLRHLKAHNCQTGAENVMQIV